MHFCTDVPDYKSDIYSALGIDEFRTQCHYISFPEQPLVVRSLWYAKIMPSLDPNWGEILCATFCEGHIFEESKSRIRAVMRIGSNFGSTSQIICELDHDPVLASVRSIPLFPGDEGSVFDGISYFLGFASNGLTTKIELDNPQNTAWMAVEQSILEVALILMNSDSSPESDRFKEVFTSHTNR